MKPFKLPLYFRCNVFGEIREMPRWVNASLFLVLWAFSVRDNEQTLCFIIIQLEFVWRHPCLYIWNAILHALDWGVPVFDLDAGQESCSWVWSAKDWLDVSSNDCSQRFCVQNRIGPRRTVYIIRCIYVACLSLWMSLTVPSSAMWLT